MHACIDGNANGRKKIPVHPRYLIDFSSIFRTSSVIRWWWIYIHITIHITHYTYSIYTYEHTSFTAIYNIYVCCNVLNEWKSVAQSVFLSSSISLSVILVPSSVDDYVHTHTRQANKNSQMHFTFSQYCYYYCYIIFSLLSTYIRIRILLCMQRMYANILKQRASSLEEYNM